jgi:hypothetical protein
MTALQKNASAKTPINTVVDRYYETLSHLTDTEFRRAAKSIFTTTTIWPSPKDLLT